MLTIHIHRLTLIFIIFIFPFSNMMDMGQKKNIEQDLLQYLFSNYSSAVRPVTDPSTLTNLTFNLKLLQLMSVDEKNEIFTVQCYYQMRWNNQLLLWNPEDWGGVTSLLLTNRSVWIPDMSLLNKGDSNINFLQKGTDAVKIYYNGEHVWYPQLKLTASFVADTTFFPFDAHNLSLKFMPWNLGTDKVRILKNNKSLFDEHYSTNSEWAIVKVDKNISTLVHENYERESYDVITFRFTYKRNPNFYITSLIVPCSILAGAIFFSYFLPASSGERSGVVVTILLAFAVFLEVVRGSLPHKSQQSILSTYIIVIMLECTISFLGTCVIITLRQKGNNEKNFTRPPAWLRRLFLKNTSRPMYQCESCRVNFTSDKPPEPCSHLTFALKRNTLGACLSHNSNDFQRKGIYLGSLQLKELQDMSRHLKIMSSAIADENDENEIQWEWNCLAKIIDRSCRWCFLIAVVISHLLLVLLYRINNPYYDL